MTRELPMPSVIDEPSIVRSLLLTQPYRLLPRQSARTMRMLGLRSFRARETPPRVPPVPQAQVKASILPLVWSQISAPVVMR